MIISVMCMPVSVFEQGSVLINARFWYLTKPVNQICMKDKPEIGVRLLERIYMYGSSFWHVFHRPKLSNKASQILVTEWHRKRGLENGPKNAHFWYKWRVKINQAGNWITYKLTYYYYYYY